MNQDAIKAMLLDIEASSLDFSVTLTGKASKKVNGLYKPDTFEILLHNKNFTTDNQLVYTAVHEYTHHLVHEAEPDKAKGTRVHNSAFFARFHALLDKAAEKGYYKLDVEASPELAALTKDIRENYLAKNGELMREFGLRLVHAQELCVAASIRFEDYVDRVLCLNRSTARSLTKIAALEIDPAMGYENMRVVASLPKEEQRKVAEEQFLQGKSPDTVRQTARPSTEKTDPRKALEEQKKRLERTIQRLTGQLEQVEKRLETL
jgi:hypothetical protein